jgi:DNA-binding transcriptional MerR regulator
VNFRIPDRTFFRIGDVSAILGVKPHVIRFWESEFPFLAPAKASSGQRVYRRSDIEALILVKHLLHIERFSIEGARKKLGELRKSARLREAMDAVLAGNPVPSGEIAIQVLPKSGVGALQQQIESLRHLIRNPESAGFPIPGLKSIQ